MAIGLMGQLCFLNDTSTFSCKSPTYLYHFYLSYKGMYSTLGRYLCKLHVSYDIVVAGQGKAGRWWNLANTIRYHTQDCPDSNDETRLQREELAGVIPMIGMYVQIKRVEACFTQIILTDYIMIHRYYRRISCCSMQLPVRDGGWLDNLSGCPTKRVYYTGKKGY